MKLLPLCISCVLFWFLEAADVLLPSSGQIHIVQDVVDVTFQLNVSSQFRVCKRMKRRLKKLSDSDHNVTQWIDHCFNYLYDTCSELYNLPQAIALRAKRQIGIAAAGLFGLFGGFISSAASHFLFHDDVSDRLAQYDKRLNSYDAMLNALAHNILLSDEYHVQREQITDLRLTLLEHRSSTMRISRGLSSIITSGRLSSDIVPFRSMKKIWSSVAALSTDFSLPFHLPPEALYELPVSVQETAPHVFNVTVSVPFTHAMATLYSVSSFPIQLPMLSYPVQLLSHDYLAVSQHNSEYWILSEKDLKSCMQISAHYFCPEFLTRLNFEDHCLSAIYRGLWDAVLQRCHFTQASEGWDISVTSNVTDKVYAIFTSTVLPYHIQCRNGSLFADSWPKGFHSTVVPSDCMIRADPFQLRSIHRIEYSLPFVQSFDWIPSSEKVHQDIKRRLLKPVTLADHEDFSNAQYPHVYLITGLSLSTAILICSWLLYCLYIYRSSRRAAGSH